MYKIIEIHAVEGDLQYVHSSILNRECEIKSATIGERGLLLVDVGDEIIGPHRILLSIVESVTVTPDETLVTIKTEHSIYRLERIN